LLRKIESDIFNLVKDCYDNVPQHLPNLIISDIKKADDEWDFSTSWAFKVARIFGLETKTFVSRIVDEAYLKENFFGKISLAGDGYINIHLEDSWINKQIIILSANFKLEKSCVIYKKNLGDNDFLISYCYSKICRMLKSYELLEKTTSVINKDNRNIAINILQLLGPCNEKIERKMLERLAKAFYLYDSHLDWSSLTDKRIVDANAVLYKACGFAIKSFMNKLEILDADY